MKKIVGTLLSITFLAMFVGAIFVSVSSPHSGMKSHGSVPAPCPFNLISTMSACSGIEHQASQHFNDLRTIASSLDFEAILLAALALAAFFVLNQSSLTNSFAKSAIHAREKWRNGISRIIGIKSRNWLISVFRKTGNSAFCIA